MDGKTPKESKSEMIQQVLPGDANHHGTVFGGKVLQWIDVAAAVSAMRHAQKPVVTASVDRVDFIAPGRIGDIMVLRSWVNYTGRSSIEVGVEVHSEDILTGKRVLTTEALVTFVAIDDKGRPIAVVPLIPETEDEKKRFEEGRRRHEERRRERKKR